MKKRIALMKSLAFVYAEHKKYIMLYLILIFVSVPTMLISPKLFQLLIDNVLLGKEYEKFIFVIAGLLIVYSLRFIIDASILYCDNMISNSFTFKVRKRIFETYRSLKPNADVLKDAGDMKLRLMDDVNNISLFTKEQIIDIIYNSLVALLGLVVLFVFNPIMAFCCIWVVPILFCINKKIANVLEKNNEEIRRINVGYSNSTFNAIKNRKEIKTQNSEDVFVARFNGFRDKLAKLEMKNIKCWFYTEVISEIKSNYISKVYVYCIGLLFLVNTKATIGDVLMFAEYFGIVFSALDTINIRNALLKEDAPFINRVMEILNTPSATKGNVPFSFNKEIEFNIESFAYVENCPILNKVKFKVQKGEFVAVAGESGCGKTTLMSFLVNANDTYNGMVCIDGTKIPDIIQSQLREKVAIVEQDEYIYNMSIRDNMQVYCNQVSDEEILTVLSNIGAMDVIQNKKQELDSFLGEGGSTLSGGQRQKLGIARALLRNPEILILDEATNALDTKSESDLIHAILTKYNITLIAVSHKPSMLKLADRVINIEANDKHEK